MGSSSPITWTPTSGESYDGAITDSLEVIYDFHDTYWLDYDLTPGMTYYYQAFAYDEAMNYSGGVTISEATEALSQPTETEPGNFTGTTSASTVSLRWDAPLNTDYKNYLVVRGSSWSPSDNMEYDVGTNGIICKGTDKSCSDRELSMGRDYEYVIYAFRKYSDGGQVYVDYGSGVNANLRTKLGGTLSANMTLNGGKEPYIAGNLTIPEGQGRLLC